MDNETTTEGQGDLEEEKPQEDPQKDPESTEGGEPGEEGEKGEVVGSGEEGDGAETVEGEERGETGEAAGTEEVEGEGLEGEQVEGEVEGGEQLEGEEVEGEGLEGEQVDGSEAVPVEEVPPEPEEEQYVEEPPPDPAAPYNFSDAEEALKAPFELRPDQIAEVEQLWETYQNCTPEYCDLDGYITEKELIYMLKCLLIMTYTMEQLQELIEYCCRPPHSKGHIFYEQFLKMVTIRQRDHPIEEELRSALQVLDPVKGGTVDREYLKEVLAKQGHKMPPKQLDNLVKEVDISNDGTIGIEDVVATMCMDLNKEDLQLLRATVYPPTEQEQGGEEQEAEGTD